MSVTQERQKRGDFSKNSSNSETADHLTKRGPDHLPIPGQRGSSWRMALLATWMMQPGNKPKPNSKPGGTHQSTPSAEAQPLALHL